MRVLPAVVALFVASLVVARVAIGASVDPDLTWRTLQTEHFDIHFHQGIEPVADALSDTAESVYDEMTAVMAWRPRGRIQVVLVDRTDQANGSARIAPYPAITLFVTAPSDDATLSLYDDWLRTLFTHELAHVLHLDTHGGIVRLARLFVGRIASTNTLSPRWIIEGQATMFETRHTTGGRGRSAQVAMIKAATVLEGRFPPLGNLDGFQIAPPSGNLRYLFGEDFMSFIADTTDEHVWTDWNHRYGRRVPYLLPSKKVFGRSLQRLYRAWQSEMVARYEARASEVRARGETVSRSVGDPAQTCISPVFSPDGSRLVFSCVDQRRGSAIWLANGDGQDASVFLKDRGASGFSWRRDGEALVYAGTHVVNRFNLWSDIYLLPLSTGEPIALTQGARARDPDFAPDGSRLLMVTNRAQTNQLEALTVDRIRERLDERPFSTQLSRPRYSPDGRWIAVSVWQEGRRDLWIYDQAGAPVRQLSDDTAIDRDPTWSADGRWLYFTSDRSGIPNIYAIDLEREELWQVTDVITGAQRPSIRADGGLLAFELYTVDGWEVHVTPLSPSTMRYLGVLPASQASGPPLSTFISPPRITTTDHDWSTGLPPARRRSGAAYILSDEYAALLQDPGERADSFDQVDLGPVFGEEVDFPFKVPVRRYRATTRQLPQYVIPFVQTTPFAPSERWRALPFSLQGNLATSGADPLGHFGWSASLNHRTDVDYTGWSASATVNRFLPVYSVIASARARPAARITVPDPTGQRDEDGTPRAVNDPEGRFYWERRHAVAATVTYPYSPRTSFFGRYELEHRRELFDIPADAIQANIPVRGRMGTVAGGWRYAWNQSRPRSISREDARIVSLVGAVTHPWLGSSVRDEAGGREGVQQVQLTAELREYLVNPLIPNHVLAVRAATGLTAGSERFLGNYQLGGPFGDGAFYVTPDGSWMVRGYPVGAAFGDRFWLTGAEYRLPLWWVERGVGTIPAYARYLALAGFIDAGSAFTEVSRAQDVVQGALIGVGAEVSGQVVLGWAGAWTGRLGYGTALTPGGFSVTDVRTVYFQLGGTY